VSQVATILPIRNDAPVVTMLSPEQEKLVALVSSVIVTQTLNTVYEESY
jgi:hypothetical protein